MVLRCECGGQVQVKDGTDLSNGFRERYECTSCGSEGGYRHYRNPQRTDETWGCVVEVYDIAPTTGVIGP